MKKLENCLYERDLHCWVEYEKSVYMSLLRERQKVRTRERKKECCTCLRNQAWYCNGICDGCCYHVTPEVSMSSPIGENGLTFENVLTDGVDLEDFCVRGIDARKVLQRLYELMPEALEFGRLKIEGYTMMEIAKILGIPRATIYTRIESAKQKLKKEFGDF